MRNIIADEHQELRIRQLLVAKQVEEIQLMTFKAMEKYDPEKALEKICDELGRLLDELYNRG
jgi:hypothetical protein